MRGQNRRSYDENEITFRVLVVQGLEDSLPYTRYHKQHQCSRRKHPCDISTLVVEIQISREGVTAIRVSVVGIVGYENGVIHGGEGLAPKSIGHIGLR